MRSTAYEVQMQIAFGVPQMSVVKEMLKESLQESFEKVFEISEKPIHIDVTRRGQWIRTKVKRYKAPLGFDPMQDFDIDYRVAPFRKKPNK